MIQALANAARLPGEIDAVIAHGTSTVVGDRAEIRAINQVFTHHPVPVMSIKGHLGHSMGAAGAMSAVAALTALRDGILPPTLGTETVDSEADFDLITRILRHLPLQSIQINAFGFGGQNASLILGSPPS